MDEALSLGLIATSYGIAQLCLASGFLAVFAAGLALHRVREQPLPGTVSLDLAPDAHYPSHGDRAIHSHHASATMTQSVQKFNEQLERLAELAIVLVVGAMLPYATLSFTLWWFIPLLFLILRPLAILAAMTGNLIPGKQYALISWFGIRGIGSVFYLMVALHHGVSGPVAQKLVTITLMTVAISIFAHGISAAPMMKWYARRSNVTP